MVASQKFTVPGVTAVPPDWTVAVSVTTVPEVTAVTGAPAEVTARVVVVAAGLARAGTAAEKTKASVPKQSWKKLLERSLPVETRLAKLLLRKAFGKLVRRFHAG